MDCLLSSVLFAPPEEWESFALLILIAISNMRESKTFCVYVSR